MKDKTLLLSEIFPPTHGGSGRWFWELYSRLEQEQHIIVAGKCDSDQAFDLTHDLQVIREDLSSPSWGIKSLTGIKFYWRVFRAVKKLIAKHGINALHCGRCLPEGVIGYLLKKFKSIPYICYIHGEDVEAASTSRELRWIVTKVLNNASALICNSQNTADLLINHWNIPVDQIEILNPGCDTNKFIPAPADEAVKKSLNWADRKVVLTVGRLQERKGQDVLITAIAEIKKSLPEVLYAIIGGGEEKQKLMALVDSLNLENNVMFMEEVSDEQMIQAYQQCDLFILPNRTVGQDIEGFGMVLVEAQACAKAVIAGNSGGTAETMRVGETGFILDCTTPNELITKVTELLQSPNELNNMGKLARQHTVAELDWATHAQKAQVIFNRLTS